ncbi:E3 ubiquitin- ligase SMURF2-like protein [Labeo rohita]|uniref:E3 ubiquitin-ligase SMURF2-like protein n=1 Tax=Labeo rohita TaxID=84645 RepID=A0A498NQY4_LABRO|nr:E3 ubiquitin- ligase SMURF2-like protein [Labeo rohita]
MASLIQDSIKPLQASLDTLRETVGSFQHRLASTEILVGENFERLVAVEATSKSLKAQNSSLLDQIDDLENRSRRANLRIINIPEGGEDGKDPIGFVSGLMKDSMESVFNSPPELECVHRALRPRPGAGQPPRPFIVCFYRYQEKEKALQWASVNHGKRKQAKTESVNHDVVAASVVDESVADVPVVTESKNLTMGQVVADGKEDMV